MSALVLFGFVFPILSMDLFHVPASLGQNVTLPCEAPSNINIAAVIWTRPDLSSQYVLLSRDGNLDTDNQQPSYEDRVMLVDIKLKDGNLSLILSNVTSSDYGTYKCYIKERKEENKINKHLISVVHLTGPVSGGKTGNSTTGHAEMDFTRAIVVAAAVAAVAAVAAAVALICSFRCTKQNSHLTVAYDAAKQMLSII
ncbi:V-set domain containing T-cell activation inhibitor 1-like [Micropterus dolomieu]|uniref:V-set domain containing T-cell activation inhibitor 1-like n=1 Tax=Micropterus dolomieu TaxID=147949 RepID=UPI001E8E52EC|nr:V-set domain containing T-cell activation inhibitor 1-like [Micropterus dolomieu]